MKVEQLTCALGAEIKGIRLAEAATNADLAGEINALLLEHKVLFLRDQDMTDAEHAGVARQFGELEDHPLANSAEGEPGIIHIWKSPESPPFRYENAWHHDATWREIPPMGAVLRCVECPPVGGDTMWSNMELAYDQLPDHVKEEIADLRARHSMEASFMAAKPIEERLAMKERYPDPEHPVVRTHPVTGKKSLFVNSFATHFTNYHTPSRVRVGQDFTNGSGELLRYLTSQAAIPEYQVRWRWTPNSVAIWDNRCTQHYAVMDYPSCVRRMNRATIVGDRPF
ncbi:TauD/TfdA family dioxygenase [Novosphingobium sp. APW14]|uniref:TauD/TfdA dioxygenase family protein n=1 Tax=Novosphingobium sp. APW14 TaxID=3077237 RepID=UPI0028E021B5|nr:TauD/TfdA family dioxygenase [Novosphingobium sp. APW14]MDT9013873.1 TauD/TfdA family dioxygenase [Novosphingobium sp. APW14]